MASFQKDLMQTFRMKRPRQKRREELAISSKLRMHGLPGMLNDLFKTDLWLWLQKFLWISQEQMPKNMSRLCFDKQYCSSFPSE